MEIVDYLLARKKAGGGSDVTIEQLSVTENGTYSEEGIAYSPVVVNVPAPENSYQLTDLPTGTVSAIEDGTDLPMPSLKVGIEPVQDLHGYDHPWAGGAGKNLLDFDSANLATGSIYGLSFIKQNDGYVKISGEYTGSEAAFGIRLFTAKSAPRIENAYVANFTTDSNVRQLRWTDADGGIAIDLQGLVNGQTYSISVRPLIYTGSAPTTWQPYSNICPISGWDEANVTRTGKNRLVNASDSYSITSSAYHYYTVSPEIPSGTTVTISIDCNLTSSKKIALYKGDSAAAILKIGDSGSKTLTFTTDETLSSFRMYISPYDETTVNVVKAQLEIGTTATTYEPYAGTTYTIEFRDGDNPLTVYGGTLDVTTGELVVDRKLLLINGDSNVSAGAYKMPFRISTPNDAKAFASAALWGSKCNMMTEVVQESSWGVPATYSFAGNLKQIYFKLTNDLTDVDELKTFLTENPIEICYFIDTPTTYHLTPTQIRTLVGNNNIWADTGDVLSGKYFKEL